MSLNTHFLSISGIVKEVKEINGLARKVYLTSLNAMLMARRASGNSLGYTRVTEELRKFSLRLEASMTGLIGLTRIMVSSTALSTKRHRLRHKIRLSMQQSAGRLSGDCIEHLESTVREHDDDSRQMMVEGRERLSISVERLKPLCRLGLNIAVLAKVEATQAGEQARVLHDIAQEMENYIERVDVCLGIVLANVTIGLAQDGEAA